MNHKLQEIAEGLWGAETRLSFLGLPITSRMTIARLPDGGLWLHSPVPLAPLKAELDRLGPVAWRVAPNVMHHLFQLPYQEAYPNSRLVAPAGLAAKRADLRIDVALSNPPHEWSDWLDTQQISGNPTLDESVFLHRESKTLILTDLAAHLGPWDHWAVRLYARMNRCYGRLGLSYGLKTLFKDRAAARTAIDAILAWDFDRIIPAHGPIIETGGKEALRRAFDWLLRERAGTTERP